jgi:hypothetical protein
VLMGSDYSSRGSPHVATKTQPTRRVGGVGIQKPGARRDGSQTLSLTPTTRFWRSVPAVVVDAQMWVAL